MQIPFGFDGTNRVKTLAMLKRCDPQDKNVVARILLDLVDKETARILEQLPKEGAGQ